VKEINIPEGASKFSLVNAHLSANAFQSFGVFHS